MDGNVKGQRVRGSLLAVARELRGRQTGAEQRLWQHLRAHRLDGHHFRRQQPIGPYIADFFCAVGRLIVEVGGPIHGDQVEYDRERDDHLAAHGLRVLRFSNDAVLRDTEHVLSVIRHALSPAPLPSPRRGRVAPRRGEGSVHGGEGPEPQRVRHHSMKGQP